jgi:hypothetical protein
MGEGVKPGRGGTEGREEEGGREGGREGGKARRGGDWESEKLGDKKGRHIFRGKGKFAPLPLV